MEQKLKINCVIGVDPGANGGIAIFIPGRITKVVRMPKDIKELQDLFVYYAENYHPIVFLEKLSVRPDDVTADGKGANMGKLYRIQKMIANYEHLKVLIETSEIPYIMVHPMTWQTKLGLRKHGSKEEKAARKNRYKEVAAKNYGDVNVTLWNADALLLMHFGRWALVNDAKWVRANLPEREYDKLF